MRVVCCQLDIVWEDKAANHAKVRSRLEADRPASGDLVILPEMFATGFTMNVETGSDSLRRETERFLSETAARFEIFLMGGVIATAPGSRGLNECIAFGPDGAEIGRYAKMHPFSHGGESRHYSRGLGPRVLEIGELAVAPFICYDLRFPEVFRTAAVRGATLFTVIANWPSSRVEHWVALLRARAIENQAYVAGVNRCGSDPTLEYPGRSLIVDPRGNVVAEGGADEELVSAEIDLAALEDYRREFPFLADIAPGYVAK